MSERMLRAGGPVWAGPSVVAGGLAACGLALVVLATHLVVLPLRPPPLLAAGVVVAAVVAACWLVWGARRPRLLADLTVAATAAYVAGSIVLVLARTPWGLMALFRDGRLRTAAVTRFTEVAATADYAYKGLPSHYPFLVSWLEGRAAHLAGLPGWELVKYGQVVGALLVPVLAYGLWCRVVPAPQAAAVVTVTTLFAGDPYKVDEWVVLALCMPWWLEAFRDHRLPGLRPRPAWLHGVVAGLLLLTYTFYFLPLALATVGGLVLDVRRRRPWRPILARYAVIVVVGLAVSAVYWLPLAVLKLTGHPTDSLQLRWFVRGVAGVPLDGSPAAGVLPMLAGGLVATAVAVLGVAYLAAVLGRRGVGEGLFLLLVAGYAVIGGGLVAASLGHPILQFKADGFVRQAMLAAGALAVFAAARTTRELSPSVPRSPALVRAAVVVVLAAVAAAGAVQLLATWLTGLPVSYAYRTVLPDGRMPGGGAYAARPFPTVATHGGGSAWQIRAALGRSASSPRAVLVVSRTRPDFFATTPVHLFTTWGAIYSNPFARFDDRIGVLRRLSAQRDPARFAALATHNGYDRIDGFVLDRAGDMYTDQVAVDGFPSAPRLLVLRFHRSQFDPRVWRVVEFARTAVISRR